MTLRLVCILVQYMVLFLQERELQKQLIQLQAQYSQSLEERKEKEALVSTYPEDFTAFFTFSFTFCILYSILNFLHSLLYFFI